MAHRKLQQEVDRVFKKVSEGMDSFNESYERREMSSSQTQRDKLENDLKKEIKKLQRLREQIKVWQTSSEVKDKDALLRNRRLVETAMERYKQVEKESKYKDFSNDGLSQPEQLSPEEQEKQESLDYVSEILEELQIQYDDIESEVVKLSTGGRKGKKYSKDSERKAELDDLMEMVKFHQDNLELISQLIQDDKLEYDAVDDLKDDIQYFLENNQDPDFMFDDSIYEPLQLNERNKVIVQESYEGINPEGEEYPAKEPTVIPPINGKNTTTKKELSSASTPKQGSPLVSKQTQISTHNHHNTTPTPGTAPSSSNGHHQTVTSLPGTSLKPAPLPTKPLGEKKWAAAAATTVKNSPAKEHKEPEVPKLSTPSAKNGGDIKKNIENHIKVESEPKSYSENQLSLINDPLMVTLAPGIQNFINSFVESRSEQTPRNFTATDFYLNQRKNSPLGLKIPFHYNEFLKLNHQWDDFRGRFQIDYSANPIVIINLDDILMKTDASILFFGFYYGLSGAERNIAKRGLYLNSWRLYNNQVIWFLRVSKLVANNKNFEVGNFEVFDAVNWTVKGLTNYQLDKTQLISKPQF